MSGRIYIEAGQEKDADYAQIWLDAKTGKLREVQMRAELQPNKLEHRYLRQVPSLLRVSAAFQRLNLSRLTDG